MILFISNRKGRTGRLRYILYLILFLIFLVQHALNLFMMKRGRTTNGEIGPVAVQIYKIWNC